MTLDDIDLAIMQATQAGLPLCTEPYVAIAQSLNLSVETIRSRLLAMKESGVIRRIGAVPNHYALGYRYNGMSVWDVDDEKVNDLGDRVGQLAFVSHCYLRPRHLPQWRYNLFAMIHAKTPSQADAHIETIAKLLEPACIAYDVLYSTRILKKTGFRRLSH